MLLNLSKRLLLRLGLLCWPPNPKARATLKHVIRIPIMQKNVDIDLVHDIISCNNVPCFTHKASGLVLCTAAWSFH
ncbi:hypothetical protein KC19_10G176100 [Ceratodon purpureus]|uniref:Secreted protein n=1 Tax=Ceratodon purpureus TaxID=3225 RepID=A0A8T0GQ86_CERPU|nr:hypothetical protein KC19_10G176100 [Ceratodon purpureus]